jgi:hypothetical protein
MAVMGGEEGTCTETQAAAGEDVGFGRLPFVSSRRKERRDGVERRRRDMCDDPASGRQGRRVWDVAIGSVEEEGDVCAGKRHQSSAAIRYPHATNLGGVALVCDCNLVVPNFPQVFVTSIHNGTIVL